MSRAVALVLALLLVGCGRSADDWAAEGDRRLRSNDLAGAERAFNHALQKDPHHAPACYGKGWALYASGHDDLRPAARQLFERAIDYDPDYWGGYRGKAVLLLEEGKTAAAERLLRTAWEKDPAEPTVLASLGQLYLANGRFDAAEQLFAAALKASPERGELHRYLADVRLAQGDYDGALGQLEVGLGSAVSGLRGLVLLQDGVIAVETKRAAEALAAATGPADPRLDVALQALDHADSVLNEARKAGIGLDDLADRGRQLRGLRERTEARKAAGAGVAEP